MWMHAVALPAFFPRNITRLGRIPVGGISTGTIDGQAFTINSGIAGSNNVTGFSLFSRSNGSSGVAGSNLGRAFFDSVNVTNVVVPEPASMAVIAVGAFGLLVRRKRSKK